LSAKSDTFRTVFAHLSTMKAKRRRFPIVVKRGSSAVKIYRDRKPTGTYYGVSYHIDGRRHRLHLIVPSNAHLVRAN
jgi:hypothetical protein